MRNDVLIVLVLALSASGCSRALTDKDAHAAAIRVLAKAELQEWRDLKLTAWNGLMKESANSAYAEAQVSGWVNTQWAHGQHDIPGRFVFHRSANGRWVLDHVSFQSSGFMGGLIWDTSVHEEVVPGSDSSLRDAKPAEESAQREHMSPPRSHKREKPTSALSDDLAQRAADGVLGSTLALYFYGMNSELSQWSGLHKVADDVMEAAATVTMQTTITRDRGGVRSSVDTVMVWRSKFRFEYYEGSWWLQQFAPDPLGSGPATATSAAGPTAIN